MSLWNNEDYQRLNNNDNSAITADNITNLTLTVTASADLPAGTLKAGDTIVVGGDLKTHNYTVAEDNVEGKTIKLEAKSGYGDAVANVVTAGFNDSVTGTHIFHARTPLWTRGVLQSNQRVISIDSTEILSDRTPGQLGWVLETEKTRGTKKHNTYEVLVASRTIKKEGSEVKFDDEEFKDIVLIRNIGNRTYTTTGPKIIDFKEYISGEGVFGALGSITPDPSGIVTISYSTSNGTLTVNPQSGKSAILTVPAIDVHAKGDNTQIVQLNSFTITINTT